MDKINEFLADWGLQAVDIIVPAAILFFGWIVAIIISSSARRVMRRTSLDERLASAMLGEERSKEIDTAAWFGRTVYWVLMLFVFVAFLARVGLAFAAEPINEFLARLFEYAPQLLGAGAVMLVAWIIARVARRGVLALVKRTRLSERLADETSGKREDIGKAISDVAYWLVFLFFMPAVLGVLELDGILGPVQSMFDELLGFLPNLLSAVVIFGAGWFVARIVQRIVSGVLEAAGLDRASETYGVSTALGDKKLSHLIGLVVHVLIIVPVTVAALDALQLAAVTEPASAMLGTMLAAGPAVFGAALVLGISYFIGRFVAGLVSNLLAAAGFDRVLVRLGLAKTVPAEGERTPSGVVAYLALIAIMLFASVEAASLLGFEMLAVLIVEFTVLAGHVGLGLALLGLGLFFADIAAKAIAGSDVKQARVFGLAARVAIIALSGAMGLRQMGIANEIIALAFGLTLGSVAIAVALAFGLGAREQAGEMVKDWRQKLRE